MKHPMFCGSLLYQFFGGSANYDHLVNSAKGPVTFGGKESVGDEPCQVVKFYGRDQYGNVEALIGEKSGYVYRIKYDSAPLIEQMQDPKKIAAIETIAKASDDPKVKAAGAAMSTTSAFKSLQFDSQESYKNIASPAGLASDAFALTPPKGETPVEAPSMSSSADAPPVPLGSPAPDFSVTLLDGKTVRLSEMRGHPVLIDFWATWCGPCVAGLPHTQELYKKGKAAGLQVLAISDEERATVAKFIGDNRYNFPTALDKTRAANKAYKILAIPTTVVIDAGGKLVAYIVGGGQDDAISEALTKAGAKLND
jgi:thiol-disulfide isomerase/thioredoxin